MIPEAQLNALRHTAETHPNAAGAKEHLDVIAAFLGEELPRLERMLREATAGPRPLDEACLQLVEAGGKRVRPVLTILVARAWGGDGLRSLPLAAANELVHSAALLHDDVIDEGELRRGRAASRVLWGNLVSVLSGDLLLTGAMALIQQSEVPGAMDHMLRTTRAMLRGEVVQLSARERIDMDVESYMRMIRDKTASLFANACRAGALAADAPAETVERVGEFGEHLGMAYQIVDDVLDLQGVPQEVGKELCHDLLEGRMTLPLTLAMQEDAAALHPLLTQARSGDSAAAMALARLPSVRQACARARRVAAHETEQGIEKLSVLPSCRERDLLADLARSLADRRA